MELEIDSLVIVVVVTPEEKKEAVAVIVLRSSSDQQSFIRELQPGVFGIYGTGESYLVDVCAGGVAGVIVTSRWSQRPRL